MPCRTFHASSPWVALVALLVQVLAPAPSAAHPAPPAHAAAAQAQADRRPRPARPAPGVRQQTTAEPPVRLLLLIAVDQFRADYLTRFGAPSKGFRTLLSRGAVFTDAHLEHGITVTAVGHSTMLSGAVPSISGIIDNAWYERASKANVESITDRDVQIVGGGDRAGIGASPRRLLVTTVGDQLKLASSVAAGTPDAPRVIGISIKDRSAILPAGHAADAAYFWRAGRFVTSTYYRTELPDWVDAVNARRMPDAYAGKRWDVEGGGHDYPAQPGPALDSAVVASPAGNELVLAMARAALEHERLGQRGVTDVLTVSFSSNDSVGHTYGPESPEVRDITRHTDRQVQELLDEVDRRVGLDRVLVAFTSDHGVAPLPEAANARRVPAGRFAARSVSDAVEAALDARFGAEAWVERAALPHVYLDQHLTAAKALDPADVRRVAADAVSGVPRVARVYTRDAILSGQVPDDVLSARVVRAYHRERSGDLHVVLEPLWMPAANGSSHGTPYGYDAHIPLVLMGPGIEPGLYHEHAALNDLAPTLSALLGLEAPSGAHGRILHEALRRQRPGQPAATRTEGTRPAHATSPRSTAP